jgi:hypothetical protein
MLSFRLFNRHRHPYFMNAGQIRWLVAVAFVGAIRCFGQPVFESATPTPVVPSSLRELAERSTLSLPFQSNEGPALFHWGPLELKPHAVDKFIYSDGILSIPGHATNTYINSLSVGVLVNAGKNWSLDYTPTWMVYTNRAFQNSVDHLLVAVGAIDLQDWLVQISQAYSKSKTPRIETGRQTSQESTDTHVNISHRFTDHISLELGGTQSLQFIALSPDFYDWSTQDWLTYRFVSRLDVSVGYRVGYTDFDPGAYMTYSQPMARMRWRITDKLSLSFQAGRETRQIHKNAVPKQTTPTYDGSIQWQPFEHTTLSARVQRAVSPSYFTNSTTDNKGWSIDLDQRLFKHLSLQAGFGGQKTHYFGTHTEFDPNFIYDDIIDENGEVVGTLTTVYYTPRTVIDIRNDSTQAMHFRLSTPFFTRGTFALLYSRTRNSSDQPGFNFTSHQIGCEIAYRF